jgi:hypothetical protein
VFTKHTSLIIPTKDRFNLLNKTIRYLFDNKIIFKKIIIVDSSKKKNKKKIIILCKKYKIKLLFTKASTSYQRNYGKEFVKKSKYIMFLDDDIIFFKDSFKEMNSGIKKYNSATGFCFNIISKKRKTIIDHIKESKLMFFLKLYNKKKGIVMHNGWHTQLLNLNKDTKVQWMYSGATIFKFKEIKDRYFLVDKSSYCYLEDLDFTYSLYKDKKILMCISNARILNPNIYLRNTFEFGLTEIVNRYRFVKKNNLNLKLFFLTSLIKFTFNFFEIFKFKFEIVFRLAGNISAIIYCLILNNFNK